MLRRYLLMQEIRFATQARSQSRLTFARDFCYVGVRLARATGAIEKDDRALTVLSLPNFTLARLSTTYPSTHLTPNLIIMSNSDKFEQDEAIVSLLPCPRQAPLGSAHRLTSLSQVADEPSINAEGGVLGGSDEPLEDSDINAPEGDYDSVSANKISDGVLFRIPVSRGHNADVPFLLSAEFKNDEFDGVSKDNIIEGERSTRGSNFTKPDEEADKLVDAAVDAK